MTENANLGPNWNDSLLTQKHPVWTTSETGLVKPIRVSLRVSDTVIELLKDHDPKSSPAKTYARLINDMLKDTHWVEQLMTNGSQMGRYERLIFDLGSKVGQGKNLIKVDISPLNYEKLKQIGSENGRTIAELCRYVWVTFGTGKQHFVPLLTQEKNVLKECKINTKYDNLPPEVEKIMTDYQFKIVEKNEIKDVLRRLNLDDYVPNVVEYRGSLYVATTVKLETYNPNLFIINPSHIAWENLKQLNNSPTYSLEYVFAPACCSKELRKSMPDEKAIRYHFTHLLENKHPHDYKLTRDEIIEFFEAITTPKYF